MRSLAALTAFLVVLIPTDVRGEDRPNVLLILIDDLNDWVGCLGGHPAALTPRIDGLAARGTLFANAHCQAPLCNPSRTSLLTGLRPTTTGVYALDTWYGKGGIDRDVEWMPEAFLRGGYDVAVCGKVFHDAYPPADERHDGYLVGTWGFRGGFGLRPEHKFVETPDPNPLVDWGVFPERDEDQDDWKVADWAIARMGAAADAERPWFLAVGFRRPHVPCYASQAWFDGVPDEDRILPPVLEGDRDDVPPFAWYLHWDLPEPRLAWLRRAGQWRALVRAYLASIRFVDSQVGRVLDALEASGAAERTIVVLASDHGFHLGEKGITGKNSLWERSTRVPLIWAGPGVAAGAVCRRPVELLDIYPTLEEMALREGTGGDGHSLAPLLARADAPRPWPAITTHGPGNHAVRNGRFRYIRYADGSEELYDLLDDPNEWRNLSGQPRYRAVLESLAWWLPRVEQPPFGSGKLRLLEGREGAWMWQGKRIEPGAAVPGL